MKVLLFTAALTAALTFAHPLLAQEHARDQAPKPPAPQAKPDSDAHSSDRGPDTKVNKDKKSLPESNIYPLSTCPISGSPLGSMGEPVVKVYGNREVRFCCAACPPKFEKDLARSSAALDEKVIKDQLPHYPLTTSVVSDKALPEKPLDFVHDNRLIRVVDEAEKTEFLKDPAPRLAALDTAVIESQTKDYPLTTCAVSGEKLGSMGAPRDVVLASRLIRLCCDSCRKSLQAEPAKFIAKVDSARSATESTRKAPEKEPQGK